MGAPRQQDADAAVGDRDVCRRVEEAAEDLPRLGVREAVQVLAEQSVEPRGDHGEGDVEVDLHRHRRGERVDVEEVHLMLDGAPHIPPAVGSSAGQPLPLPPPAPAVLLPALELLLALELLPPPAPELVALPAPAPVLPGPAPVPPALVPALPGVTTLPPQAARRRGRIKRRLRMPPACARGGGQKKPALRGGSSGGPASSQEQTSNGLPDEPSVVTPCTRLLRSTARSGATQEVGLIAPSSASQSKIRTSTLRDRGAKIQARVQAAQARRATPSRARRWRRAR